MNFASNSSTKSAYPPPHVHGKSYYHQYRNNTKFNNTKFPRTITSSPRGGFHSGGGGYHGPMPQHSSARNGPAHDGSSRFQGGCGFKSFVRSNNHFNMGRNRHSRFNKFNKVNRFNKFPRPSHHNNSYSANGGGGPFPPNNSYPHSPHSGPPHSTPNHPSIPPPNCNTPSNPPVPYSSQHSVPSFIPPPHHQHPGPHGCPPPSSNNSSPAQTLSTISTPASNHNHSPQSNLFLPPPNAAPHLSSSGAHFKEFKDFKDFKGTHHYNGNGNGDNAGSGGHFKAFKHRKSRWNRKPDDMLSDQNNNKLIASTLSLFKDPSIERKIKEIEGEMERESKLSKSRTVSDDDEDRNDSRAHSSKKSYKRRSTSSSKRRSKRTSSRSHSRNPSTSRSRSRSRLSRKRKEKKERSDSEVVDMSISDRDSDSTASSPDHRSTPSASKSKTPPNVRPKSVSRSPSKSPSKSARSIKSNKSKSMEMRAVPLSASSSSTSMKCVKSKDAEEKKSKYVVSKDLTPISIHFRNIHSKRNYAKHELERKSKITSELQKYMKRTAKRKRSGSNYKPTKLKHPAMQQALSEFAYLQSHSMADNEMSSSHLMERDDFRNGMNIGHLNSNTNSNGSTPRGNGNEGIGTFSSSHSHSHSQSVYDHDLNNSDAAIYEPPFKKPKFMTKMKDFASRQTIHPQVLRKAVEVNDQVMSYRLKHRDERMRYIKMERTQSEHWNRSPKKCWFYRCVHMLEGHVENMCLSPDMAPGVMAPIGPLNEIESKLARIHPLPPLIYKRLMKTLRNLSNLIRTYPSAVVWDRDKLNSIFEKAIRKQVQMKSIYDFESAQFEEYDFSPFALPQHEVQRISFYREGEQYSNSNHHNANGMRRNHDSKFGANDKDRSLEALGPLNAMNRRLSTMSGITGLLDDDMDEEEDDDDDEGEEDGNGFGSIQCRMSSMKSRSISPLEGTPALSLASITPTNDMDLDSDGIGHELMRKKMNLSINTNIDSRRRRVRSGSRSQTPITPKTPILLSSTNGVIVSSSSKRRGNDELPMDTPLYMDLVRKSTVKLNTDRDSSSVMMMMTIHPIHNNNDDGEEDENNGGIKVSEGIKELVIANWQRLERQLDGNQKSNVSSISGDGNTNSNTNGVEGGKFKSKESGNGMDIDSKGDAMNTGTGRAVSCTPEGSLKLFPVSSKPPKRRVTWYVDGLDSNDEHISPQLKEQKVKLQEIFRQNGVYGPIRAIGLEPTKESEIPMLYELPPKYRNLYDHRTPSISYLISNYVDTTNPWYIKLLLKFFTISLRECCSESKECPTERITVEMIRKQLTKRPSSMRRCYIGDTKEEEVYFWYNINDQNGNQTDDGLNTLKDTEKENEKGNGDGHGMKEVVWSPFVRSTLLMELYLDLNLHEKSSMKTTTKDALKSKTNSTPNGMYSKDKVKTEEEPNLHHIRLRLKESKRHKLLCTLLRIKNHRKKSGRGGVALSIPPPPPPASEDKKVSQRILQMNSICVNYNWNGNCEATYCGKKHVCSSCYGKHPARICKRQCIHFNWAKCQKYCPWNKQHSCSQCGHKGHPAWKCPYLHKSVIDRYYAIYKTKKMKKGHLRERELKKRNKNHEEMARIIKKNCYSTKDSLSNKLQNQIVTLNQNLNNVQGTTPQGISVRRHHLGHHHGMAAAMRRTKPMIY